LLTRIIARIVAPRKTSSERRRPVPGLAAAAPGDKSVDALAIDSVKYSDSRRQILATCDSIDAVDTLIGALD
jgi:hypothetical protein